jgi:predicted transposase YdaD
MLGERIDSWNEHEREKGRQEGLQQGLQQGRQEGRQQGRQEVEAETLLLLLETRFGSVDQATRGRIATADADQLVTWIKHFATAESLGDVFND